MEVRRLKIREFTGKSEEWLAWKDKFEAVMYELDLLDTLESGPPKTEGGSGASPDEASPLVQWEKDNKKIYYQLVYYTDGAAARLVTRFRSTKDGYKAWRGLISKYEHQGTIGLVTLHGEINKCRMEDSEDPDMFFTRLSKI